MHDGDNNRREVNTCGPLGKWEKSGWRERWCSGSFGTLTQLNGIIWIRWIKIDEDAEKLMKRINMEMMTRHQGRLPAIGAWLRYCRPGKENDLRNFYYLLTHSNAQAPETRTCHWGFDSANWAAYIQVNCLFIVYLIASFGGLYEFQQKKSLTNKLSLILMMSGGRRLWWRWEGTAAGGTFFSQTEILTQQSQAEVGEWLTS